MAVTVTLKGGPFDGQFAPTLPGQTLSIDGPGVPDGQVARYRPSWDPEIYTFRGFATVLARIDTSGEQEAMRS